MPWFDVYYKTKGGAVVSAYRGDDGETARASIPEGIDQYVIVEYTDGWVRTDDEREGQGGAAGTIANWGR